MDNIPPDAYNDHRTRSFYNDRKRDPAVITVILFLVGMLVVVARLASCT